MLAIVAVIMLLVFLAVPALERSSRNNGRETDISIIETELLNYYAQNQAMPGPYVGGWCFEYNLEPAPGRCPPAADFFNGILPELGFYTNIDQFFYATDQGGGYSGYCTNPLTDSNCTGSNRNISAVILSTDDVFIDSSSVCVGNDQETWTNNNQTDEIITFALETSNGPDYQCIDVLGNGASL